MKDFSESDSLLDRRPPGAVSCFIYFLVFLFSVAFIYIWYGHIEIVVKSHGIIRPVETVSRICNITGGTIGAIYYKQGQRVEAGDLLLKIDVSEMENDHRRIEDEIEKIKVRRALLLKLIDSIDLNRNLFDSDKEREFYHRYSHYALSKEKLELERDHAGEKYEIQVSLSNYVARSDLDDLEYIYKKSVMDLNQYIIEYQIALENERQDLEKSLGTLLSSRDSLEKKIRHSSLNAPVAGKINIITDLNTGDFLFSLSEVLHIIPDNSTHGKVEIALSNKEVAGVNVDDVVRYRIPSLPMEKYGVMEGQIFSIPFDMKSTADGMFVIEGTCDFTTFQNNEIEPVALKNGMYVDVRIVTRKRRILFYLLDKMGLLSQVHR